MRAPGPGRMWLPRYVPVWDFVRALRRDACVQRTTSKGQIRTGCRWAFPVARSPPAHPPWNPIVTLILASRPNVYSSSSLDRMAARREDAAWIEQQLVESGHAVRAGLAQPQPGARPGRGRAGGGVRLRRGGRRVAHAERPVGLPRHARRAGGVRRRCQRGRRPGAAAARIGWQIRRPALGRLGRAAAGGVGPGACARADALARAAPVLRRVRRRVRRALGRPRDGHAPPARRSISRAPIPR